MFTRPPLRPLLQRRRGGRLRRCSETRAFLECAGRAQRRRRFGGARDGRSAKTKAPSPLRSAGALHRMPFSGQCSKFRSAKREVYLLILCPALAWRGGEGVPCTMVFGLSSFGGEGPAEEVLRFP